MLNKIALSRPASSAIAAFLVLSTPVALAQQASDMPMTSPVAVPPVSVPPINTPPTVADPTPVAPAQPRTTEAASPQPVIRVPLDTVSEPVQSAPAPRERQATKTQPPVKRAASPAPKAVAAIPDSAATPAQKAPPIAEATAFPSPAIAAETVVAPPRAPASETPATLDSSLVWQIAAGAVALLILGGAGLAFAHRRREVTLAEDDTPPVRAEGFSDAPVARPLDRTPPMRSTPGFAAAPQGSMGRHEALALAGPTANNPYVTLKNRLKRARFLDRCERAEYDGILAAQKDARRAPASAWEISQRPVPSAPQQEVRRLARDPAQTGSLRPGWYRS